MVASYRNCWRCYNFLDNHILYTKIKIQAKQSKECCICCRFALLYWFISIVCKISKPNTRRSSLLCGIGVLHVYDVICSRVCGFDFKTFNVQRSASAKKDCQRLLPGRLIQRRAYHFFSSCQSALRLFYGQKDPHIKFSRLSMII